MKPPPDFSLRCFVVAILDIMGESERLCEIRDLPDSDLDMRSFRGKVDRALGPVYKMREAFKTQVANLVKGIEMAAPGLSLAYEMQTFGDSVVVYHEYDADNLPSVAVTHAALLSCAVIVLLSLQIDIPIRCGIELGMATDELFEHEIFGPVLAEAHHIESHVASFPRIVVGPRLVADLARVSAGPPAPRNQFDRLNRFAAYKCGELLKKDVDGQWVVDYLGDVFTATVKDELDVRKEGEKAYRRMLEQEAKFAGSGNSKVAGVYTRLRAYFESRGFG
ncbi:MAG TPA: hypothetical protein VMH22_13485 [bacterium]|nr:hypothetical protein [bacterium]